MSSDSPFSVFYNVFCYVLSPDAVAEEHLGLYSL